MRLVFPKKIDMKAAQYELQNLIDAFLDLADQLIEEEQQTGKMDAVHTNLRTGGFHDQESRLAR
ncbi:MAG: hypothetical protein HZB44_03760 [Actinobacteria bacterium]|nr:hypothetical protein [Actinomycetota bacterium]